MHVKFMSNKMVFLKSMPAKRGIKTYKLAGTFNQLSINSNLLPPSILLI